jgi:hypothetical protein
MAYQLLKLLMTPKLLTYSIHFTFLFLLVSCGSPLPTSSPLFTPVAAVSPLEPARTKAPTLTSVIMPSETPMPTTQPTPTIQPTLTNTPVPCPPFEIDTKLPNPDTRTNYIGRHFDSLHLPKDLDFIFGAVLDDLPGYVWEMVQKSNGDYMYWIERINCHNSAGKAYFTIEDVLVVPRLKKGQDFASSCKIGEKEIPWIIAVGWYKEPATRTDAAYGWQWQFYKVDYAWHIDPSVIRFVQIPAEDLVCVKYADWGFYPTPTPVK